MIGEIEIIDVVQIIIVLQIIGEVEMVGAVEIIITARLNRPLIDRRADVIKRHDR